MNFVLYVIWWFYETYTFIFLKVCSVGTDVYLYALSIAVRKWWSGNNYYKK